MINKTENKPRKHGEHFSSNTSCGGTHSCFQQGPEPVSDAFTRGRASRSNNRASGFGGLGSEIGGGEGMSPCSSTLNDHVVEG